MDIQGYIATQKKLIDSHMRDFLSSHRSGYARIPNLGPEMLNRLVVFATEGKSVRGGLIMLSSQMFGQEDSTQAIDIAVGYELLHAGLLIHDDILDQDPLRRRAPSIYASYSARAKQAKLIAPDRYGQSMGINMGDISYALAFESVLQVWDVLPEESMRSILCLWAKETQTVLLGQAMDTHSSHLPTDPSVGDIETVNTYKTARYTFSVPLLLGAYAAGAPRDSHTVLDALGINLGLIYQLRDDELDFFESDIQNNKKTLLRAQLFESVSAQEKARLKGIFGTDTLEDQDRTYIEDLLEKYKVRSMLHTRVDNHTQKARKQIDELDITVQYNALLNELVDYILKRDI